MQAVCDYIGSLDDLRMAEEEVEEDSCVDALVLERFDTVDTHLSCIHRPRGLLYCRHVLQLLRIEHAHSRLQCQ